MAQGSRPPQAADERAIPATAELVLHIGGPKTGSSAVQRMFCEQAAALRRQGVHYPPHPLDTNGVSGGHGELITKLTTAGGAAGRDELGSWLTDARRAGCRLLLSAENAWEHAAAIADAVRTRRFHVVCFVRHPLDALASHHNQGVKRHAGRATIVQATRAVLENRVPTESLSGDVLFQWLSVCGRERMTLLPYIESGRPVDAPARLARLLGVECGQPVRPGVNRSYTPAAIEFKRLVNHLPPGAILPLDAPLDLRLQQYSDNSPVAGPGLRELVGDEMYGALERHFQPVVERLTAVFGIRLECRDAEPATAVDSPELVWRFVSEDHRLASGLRAATATALAAESPSSSLRALARIVAVASGPDSAGRPS